MNRLRRIVVGAGAAILVVGCGSDSTAPTHQSGIRIDAGADATDSIGVILRQLLVVQVRDSSGAVVRGVVVRFIVIQKDSVPWFNALQVKTPHSQDFFYFAADSTDALGRTAVLVELGSAAGRFGIAISVPELELADTAWYTVQPGRPTHFALGVRDTVVSRGTVWDLRPRVMDRGGNALPSDSVTFESLNADATVTQSGHVTASDEGRVEIEARYRDSRDTARASVVPPGSLVGVRPAFGVYLMNLDGTDRKMLTAIGDHFVFPQWSPDGTRITIYEGDPNLAISLTAVSLDGTRTPIVPTPGTLLGGAAWARPDMSGHLYFSGPRSDTHAMGIWRMNADGSGLVELCAPTNAYDFPHPAPSPDGKTVLYDFDPQGIMAIDVLTGSVHPLGLQGFFPVYSPDGASIVYINYSALMIANSDGTNARALPGSFYTDQVSAPSWSADGKWIIAPRPGQVAALVRISDGVVLPLQFTSSFNQLALH